MTIALDSFNATLFDAFIQSKLDVRGGVGVVHERAVIESVNASADVTLNGILKTVSAKTGSTTRGWVACSETDWPPVTPNARSTPVLCGIDGPAADTYYWIRRGLFQFDVPSGITIKQANLNVTIESGFLNSSFAGMTVKFYEISDFAPINAADYSLSGTLVASQYIEKLADTTYYIPMSGYSITAGAVYSLRAHCSLEGTQPASDEVCQAKLNDIIQLKLIT
jgi:hypothetical protein